MAREISGTKTNQVFSFGESGRIHYIRPPNNNPIKSSGKKKKIIYIPSVNKKSRYD